MRVFDGVTVVGDSLWIPVRDPHTHKLLFRYDPGRQLIEICERGKVTLVDLAAEAEKCGANRLLASDLSA